MKSSRIANGLLIAFAVVLMLIYGKALLIPFVIALIFWFLIKEIRDLLNKIKFIDEKIPNLVLNIIGFAFIFAIIGGVVKILTVNIQQLSVELPVYQNNISKLTESINSTFNIDLMSSAKEFLGKYEYTKLLSGLFNSLTDIFGDAFLIIIYTLFLLLEEPFFSKKIKAIYAQKDEQDEVNIVLKQLNKSIGRYISLKTLISLLTGTLSYFALLFIGLDAPLFWAFLIFLMNYIPAIGSLIATVFPAMFAMLQFGDLMPGVWVLIIVGAIQLIVGNFIDPKLTGSTLNVSPLVVLIGLAFWGAIWGIIGMILSVPITVALIIIFAEFPRTQAIAILLTKDGKILKKEKTK
ncbi:MAG: AI-2E family transporter [Bacteroidales bacterium]|jgi:AI-2 transport protein TqsA|nr:AI-2E family transporter [Bacteroidales bacterium]